MKPLILITGATGYVGGELLKALHQDGYPVRCLVRRPEALKTEGLTGVEVKRGDVLNPASVHDAMAGVTIAYYLVHSMASAQSFEDQDRVAAQNFANAARTAGVQRIIYLGGLGQSTDQLSAHLRSRQEVGEILKSTGVPVIEFRASVVIGSGSLSFEMIRALVERLPVMIAPRWVSVAAQPIAIADLLAYLIAALDLPLEGNQTFEIGGSDRVSYGGLMREYARQRGLKRLVISVPFLTPRLSSLWLGLITPLYVRVGRKLIDSIRHETVVQDRAALSVFPIQPCGFREAIEAALRANGRHLLTDSRTIRVSVGPEAAFAPIRKIGGARGWYYANWLWRLRGWLDKLAGGVGLRRGRRDADALQIGDTVDFWRVVAIEPGQRLLLSAEMKLPGRAWLEFEVTGDSTGCWIRQTATFDARGLLGRAYWYAVCPLHEFVFSGMLRGIAARADNDHRTVRDSTSEPCRIIAGEPRRALALSESMWEQLAGKPQQRMRQLTGDLNRLSVQGVPQDEWKVVLNRCSKLGGHRRDVPGAVPSVPPPVQANVKVLHALHKRRHQHPEGRPQLVRDIARTLASVVIFQVVPIN